MHEHRWCRETGSSALVCLGCAAVYDHEEIRYIELKDFDREALKKFASHCHCIDPDDGKRGYRLD